MRYNNFNCTTRPPSPQCQPHNTHLHAQGPLLAYVPTATTYVTGHKNRVDTPLPLAGRIHSVTVTTDGRQTLRRCALMWMPPTSLPRVVSLTRDKRHNQFSLTVPNVRKDRAEMHRCPVTVPPALAREEEQGILGWWFSQVVCLSIRLFRPWGEQHSDTHTSNARIPPCPGCLSSPPPSPITRTRIQPPHQTVLLRVQPVGGCCFTAVFMITEKH